MADMSKFYEKAREIDKANGVVSESGSMAQYYAKAREIDRKNGNVSPAAPTTTPNTTRAAGAGVGGKGEVKDLVVPRLEIQAFGAGSAPNVMGGAKRIGNVLAAAGTGTAATFVETAGQLTQSTGLTIGESARVALQGGTRAQEQAAEQAKAQRIREKIKDPLYATADKLTEQSAAYTEKAKEGLGKVGQFAVDLGVTGTQMLGDMALGLINPALGTGAMATRVFGGSAQEARAAGATETEQQLYGLGSAATAVLVEKIANVGKAFKTAYGGSIAGGKVDDLLTKLTGKLMKNPAGQRILASAAGEAGEEALEALLQPALQAIYDKGATLDKTWFGSTEELTDYLTDVGYNALLGGALGALGGGGNVTAPTTTETAQGGAETAQKAQSAPAVGNETPAPAEGAQRQQNAPVRLEDTAAAGILLGAAPQKQRAGFTSLENAMANQFERETGISIESVESILGGLANGDYNSANWVARIAQDAKDPKMVVVAHELTHHLQTLAPQEYESFRTAVVDYFTRAGGEAALTDMMNRYRGAYGAAGQNLSDSAVMDEMAADFTEVLLTDADLFGKFARENRTLAERLLDALRAFIDKIRATFTGRARDAAAQKATGKTLNELEMIAEQWQGVYSAAAAAYGQNANTATQEGDGVVRYKRAGMADKKGEKANAVPTTVGGITEDAYSSGEVAPTINTAPDIRLPNLSEGVNRYSLNSVGAQYDEKTQSAAPRYSLKTWNASSYVEDREKAAAELARDIGVTEQEAVRYIDDINGVAKMIADDQERLDYEPNLADDATVLKPNAEYKYTVDMSTLCAKRLLFTGTFDMLQRRFPNTAFTGEDLTMLRSMMQEKGMEVACGFCYVESTRREMGPITQEFIRQYTKAQETGEPIKRVNAKGEEVVLKGAGNVTYRADKNFTPTMADLNTTDIDLVKRDHRDVYNAYLAFMNARGQAKPKLLETRAEYKGEILQHFKAKSAVDARNNHGGLRLQSYSDFEVPHMIDMMQIIMDMSRVGLKSQAYTKVPAFAAVFGDTGVKINMSLVAKGSGVDENGNLLFDDVEGMNHEEAFRLRDMYSENVGTILVGKNDDHIRAAMADPRIDFIIPFHKSSWKESMYEALGLTGYDDYTTTQNEKPIDPQRKISNFDPSEYWDFSKSGDENAQIYLEKCRADGRTPKFPQFAGEPGYWKMLIDFKMYDNSGVGSPQKVVAPTFNMEEAYRVLEEYKGGHREFPVAYDVVDEFAARFMMEGRAQLKSTAPLRQMMRDIRMPRLTTVAQDEAEAAAPAAVENELRVPQLSEGFTDADVPGNVPLTRQDIAREMAWRQRMANEPAAPQTVGELRVPNLSEDVDEAGMGVADFTGNVETVPQEATAEILSALEDLSRDMEAPMETPTDATVRDAESLISAETVEAPQSLKEKAAESWAFFKRKMVDSGEAVTQIGKAINDKYLYPFYNMARASASAGANMIAEEQTDVNGRTVGESLNAIFDPIRAKGKDYYVNFQTYMYDLHNIARMSMDKNAQKERDAAEAAKAEFLAEHPKFINMTREQARRKADSIDELEAEEAKEYLRLERWQNRAASMGNKPVFDYEFSTDMSRGRSERLLREHPEFAQYRDQVRKYIDNLMKYRVDSGLMTQKNADFLREYYPDYVPTDRHQAFEDFGPEIKEKRVRIAKTVKRAKGGNEKLVPLHEALGKQTMQVVREGSKNRFGARLLADYTANASDAEIAKYIRDAKETEADFDINSFDEEKKTKENTFSVYFDGKLYEMEVNDALLEAVQALSPSDNLMKYWPVELSHNLNKLYKAMITGYHPTFAIRNTVRDLQTAGLYSRNFAAWAKNYPKALQEIAKDGEMWKQYKALGGDFSSVYDYATGTVRKPNTVVGKVADKMQALNMAMEQAPRLAEFMAVMEKGDGSMESAMDAMLAAADVTTNFGRSGTWGKVLNAHIVPFLNPGIQGFDKMVRYATQSKNGKQFLMMVARAAALGIAPSLINALLYHDDEEWEELRDSDKDTNYMFKLKDGLWLKIPKGRELSVLGIAADRVGDAIRGEDVNIRATLNTIGTQVAPANPLNENIAKAWLDADLFNPSSPGRTWYGGDIEGQRLQNYAPGERYDSSTDVVSKAIGGALGLSPKKLNYLADQYTGVVGDIVLPLLTPQAERDMFSKAFTVDSISSNELSQRFYEAADELKYAKNSGDATAAVVSRYWSKVSSEVSALYGEIRAVEESNLSNREKKAQVQQLQVELNAVMREALATKERYEKAADTNSFVGTDDDVDYAYRETNREVFGAEYALEAYNKDVYAKAQEAAKSGVSYEAYYDYYFATKDIESDKDASGKTVPGSKRKKVLAAINAMNLTVEQKNALYYASGYAESTLYEAPWYTIQVPRL